MVDIFISASPPAAVRLDANITWVYLANSSQIFGFSENELGFYEARNACANFGSNVILANLDKYFYEVQEYVYNFRREQQIWVDASRPTSGKYSIFFQFLVDELAGVFCACLVGSVA